MMKTPEMRVIIKNENGHFLAALVDQAGSMNPGECLCYAPIGQHGSASVNYVANLPKAGPQMVLNAVNELEAIGYKNIRIMRRFSQSMQQRRKEQLKAV